MKKDSLVITIQFFAGKPAKIKSIYFRNLQDKKPITIYSCYTQKLNDQPFYRLHLNAIYVYLQQRLGFEIILPDGKFKAYFENGKLCKISQPIFRETEISQIVVNKKTFDIVTNFLTMAIRNAGTLIKEIKE